jgi:fluoride exporter
VTYLAVAFGGALGAMSRFWVYNAFLNWTDDKFPYATLIINILGSFLIGLAFVLITERAQIGPEWRGIITVGFLGAFTTFSTFSLDVVGLIEQGQSGSALVYILSSVVVCIIAAWLGLTLAREFI